jgi:hypothetical protein
MEPFDEDEPPPARDRGMGLGLQIILGFFLVALFCGFVWLARPVH